MPRSSHRTNLTHWEICLIKGLADDGMSQQTIIAYFSFPERTVHHNVVSDIARRVIFGSDVDYPPAPLGACEAYTARWSGSYGEHRWAVFASEWPNYRGVPFRFAYRYHPVGQGIFCSGRLSRPGRPDFRWVYDCGTQHGSRPKRRAHVQREIAALRDERPQFAATPHLDLVTLSHFDEDHLSGLLDLLAEFTVGTLLLPHLTPWERLVVAIIEDADAGSDLLDFLLEPTGFLLERAGEGRIGRILLVESGGEGPALPPMLPPDGRPRSGEETFIAPDMVDKSEPAPEENSEDAGGADRGLGSGKVQMLPRGCGITIGSAWEFVPYNDARLADLADDSFWRAAAPLAARLDRNFPQAVREDALADLIALYHSRFASPGKARMDSRRANEISLFLYSGPIGAVELVRATESVLRHRLTVPAMTGQTWTGGDRFGQLFTGDGFLQTDRQWQTFCDFFLAHGRLHRGAVFQVMHHGSKANYRSEVAPTVAPVASIFCSDPAGSLHHPDWPVLKSFQAYHPTQVDMFHGWMLEGVYAFV